MTPEAIRCDIGPELISEVFPSWCKENDIENRHNQPDAPKHGVQRIPCSRTTIRSGRWPGSG